MSKQQNRNKTPVSMSLPLSAAQPSPAQSLIRSNGAPKEKQPTTFLTTQKFLGVQQFFSAAAQSGRHRVLPAADLPQNKSLAGGRLALASVACLLADYDGDWRLRLLDYSRPPPTAFPLMAWQEGYEIDGWMLNDATEQQEGKGGCDEDMC